MSWTSSLSQRPSTSNTTTSSSSYGQSSPSIEEGWDQSLNTALPDHTGRPTNNVTPLANSHPKPAKTALLIAAPLSAILIILGAVMVLRHRSSSPICQTYVTSINRLCRRPNIGGYSDESDTSRIPTSAIVRDIGSHTISTAFSDSSITHRLAVPSIAGAGSAAIGRSSMTSSRSQRHLNHSSQTSMIKKSPHSLGLPTISTSDIAADTIVYSSMLATREGSLDSLYSPIVQPGSMESYIDLSSSIHQHSLPQIYPTMDTIDTVAPVTPSLVHLRPQSRTSDLPTFHHHYHHHHHPLLPHSPIRFSMSGTNATAASGHLRHSPLPPVFTTDDDRHNSASFAVW